MSESTAAPSRTWLLVAVIAAAAPVLAGAFVSTGWSWGWDHLHRAGAPWRWGALLVFAAAWIPACARSLERWADRAGAFLQRRSLLVPVAVALVAAAAFAAFPIATHGYGDSLVLLRYHTRDTLLTYWHDLLSLGVRFRGSAVLALHKAVARAAGTDLATSYRIVGTCCGGVFVFAHARMASRLTRISNEIRLAILWLGLVDGANQLFFGHIETYAVPRLFSCLFLMRVVLSLNDPERFRPRVRDLAWLLLAIVCHVQAAALLPAGVLWVVWSAARTRPALRVWTGAPVVALGLGAAVLGLGVLYVASGAPAQNYLYSGGSPSFAQVFLPISTPAPGAPFLKYTLFAPAHLLDLFGSLWCISSAATLFVLLLLLPRLPRDRGLLILLPAVFLGFVHDILLNPSIGFPFDWDLMCVISPPLLYTAVYLLARTRPSVPQVVPLLPALGLATLALFAVNAGPATARHRVQDMAVWLHRTYYAGTHYRLDTSFAAIGDPEREIAEREQVFRRLLARTWRGDHEVAMEGNNLGLRCYERGQTARALAVFRAVAAVDPDVTAYKKPLGILESVAGDRELGIRLLEQYLRAKPGDAGGWMALGSAELAQRRPDRARQDWSRSLELSPESPDAPSLRAALARLEDAHRE